jgi:acetyl-CoA C-acetyltransferase
MTKFGELFDQSVEQMLAEAFSKAVHDVDKGLDPDRIEAFWYGNCMGSLSGNEIPSGAFLTNVIGQPGKPASRIENGCPTGSDTFRHACMGVASGLYDVVAAIGVDKMSDKPTRKSLLESGRIGHPTIMYGTTATTLFAPQIHRHMEEFGTTKEQLAMVGVKAHHNGSLNPDAHYRNLISVEDVLNSPLVCSPLNLFDCCPQTDGAACVIMCRPDIAHEFTAEPIYVAGLGLATDPLYYHEKEVLTGWACTSLAARQAYKMAGVGPDDIDVAEVHDCFSGVEIMNYEDLGFCDKGLGGKLIQGGETTLKGRIPVNPSGGLMAKGHPVGATGIAQILELYNQLRERTGERQVRIRNGYGLQHNVGGYSIAVSVVSILAKTP